MDDRFDAVRERLAPLAAAFLGLAFFAVAFFFAVFVGAAFFVLPGDFFLPADLAGPVFFVVPLAAFLAALVAAAPVAAALFVALRPVSAVRLSSSATWRAKSSRLVTPSASSWWPTSLRTCSTNACRPLRLRSSNSSTRALASAPCSSPPWMSSSTSSSAFARVMLVKAIPASR